MNMVESNYMYKISVLIVNYNCEHFIAKLLKTLQTQTIAHSDFEVIIVNNSINDVLKLTIDTLHDVTFNIKIIQNGQNIGFGKANNLAASKSNGEYLVLINPDISISNQNFLEALYSTASASKDVGIFSCNIIEKNNKITGPFFSYPFNVRMENLSGDIHSVIGALMLIPTNVFNLVGGFDEDYFLYEEDIDLCLRIRKVGFSIMQINTLSVNHVGGVSEVNTNQYEYTLKKKRGVYLFCFKHYKENVFYRCLHSDFRKSYWKKVKLWLEVYLLRMNKKSKLDYWRAVHHAAKLTLVSTAWLYNK